MKVLLILMVAVALAQTRPEDFGGLDIPLFCEFDYRGELICEVIITSLLQLLPINRPQLRVNTPCSYSICFQIHVM